MNLYWYGRRVAPQVYRLLRIEKWFFITEIQSSNFQFEYRANPPLMAARLNLGTIMKVAPNDAFDWLLQITPPSIMGMRPFLFGLA